MSSLFVLPFIGRVDILWAANTVVFTAVPSVIYTLAEDFDEIAEIRYDPLIDESLIIDPTETPHTVLSGNGENPTPQPGLILINAPAVWAAGDSGQGVLAANHDSGCDWDHPDLINNIWNNLGEDFNGNGVTVIWNGSAWVDDANRTDKGKPKGILPAAVRFDNDEIGGYSNNWYDPNLGWHYYEWKYLGGVMEMYNQLLGMYELTGDDHFLAPLSQTYHIVQNNAELSNENENVIEPRFI